MPEIILPCPACGSRECESVVCTISADEHQSLHYNVECCGCYASGPVLDAEADAITAWNELPRALTWTHEPPKVAGWYWMRRKLHGKWRNRGIVHIYMDFAGTKTLQAKGWGRQVGGLENMGIDFEWAGPIAPPVD